MLEDLTHLTRTLTFTLLDVLPIILVVVVFQLLVIRRPFPNWRDASIGFLYVVLGLAVFLEGLELAVFPLGTLMAQQLTDATFIFGEAIAESSDIDWRDYGWVYVFAAAIGFASSIAEPAVIAVAMKIRHVSGGTIKVWGLRLIIALGAALGMVVGSLRLVTGIPLAYLMIPAYLLLLLQTYYAPKLMVPIAYDSGGVTTSIVTVPLVTALGLGLAASLPGRSPLIDGFGLVAFACLFPVMTVMGYAQLAEWWGQRRKHRPSSDETPK